MTTQLPPTDNSHMDFPKYESLCHGAPVEIRKGKIKYWCIECGEACIARRKK